MSSYSAMLNTTYGKYDVFDVWVWDEYTNVAAALIATTGLPYQIADNEARIDALDVKQGICWTTRRRTSSSPNHHGFSKRMSHQTSYMQRGRPRRLSQMQLFPMGLMAI